MAIMGIHDAHDCGAAVVDSGSVVSAINEERFTKKKNDVGFPYNSVAYAGGTVGSDDIEGVAVPWVGGSALFARMFPSLETKRRSLWRREGAKPSALSMNLRNMAFRVLQPQKPRALWKIAGSVVGGSILRRKLAGLGIDKEINFVEHHTAHASAAYFASGMKEAIVITLDGAGDGVSGSVSVGESGNLKRISEFAAGASLGILYGAATIACDMRYSEDEGKLMSLAAYSYPERIDELNAISHYDSSRRELVSSTGMKYELLLAEYMRNNLLWKHNREAFAYAVQRHVEEQVIKMVKQHIKETGIRNVAVGGGLFSNIIINMLIDRLPEVKDFFVFPHMGDGGLSLGAAYYLDFEKNGKFSGKRIDNVYYGPSYSNESIKKALKKYGKKIKFRQVSDIERFTAEKLAEENRIVLWFQGRMEYGPRALGNRSVLAMPNHSENRDRINLIIKKRPYYQPFASTILEEDAPRLLERYRRKNKFMTVGYKVRDERLGDLVAASHIDGTTRPQFLGAENPKYAKLLMDVKRISGTGALLNTSLNKHGMPIVMTPDDAIWTLLNTGAQCLSIGDFFVEKV